MADGTKLGLGFVTHSTDKALRIKFTELGEEKWIPLSVIHDDSELYNDKDNDEGEVVVEAWWAEKEGLV